MKQTSNYQLNQWEMTDRIQMEDFNRDNEKVDAALAEVKVTADRANSLAGMRLLAEAVLEEDQSTLILSLDNVEWSDYAIVCVDVEPLVCGQTQTVGFSFCSYGGSNFSVSPIAEGAARAIVQFWMAPMHNPDCLLRTRSFGLSEDKTHSVNKRLRDCEKRAQLSADLLLAGTRIQVWGLK